MRKDWELRYTQATLKVDHKQASCRHQDMACSYNVALLGLEIPACAQAAHTLVISDHLA